MTLPPVSAPMTKTEVARYASGAWLYPMKGEPMNDRDRYEQVRAELERTNPLKDPERYEELFGEFAMLAATLRAELEEDAKKVAKQAHPAGKARSRVDTVSTV